MSREETLPDVSSTLLRLLNDALSPTGPAAVTLGPPKNATSRLTLVLYKVIENPYLKNDDRRVTQRPDGRLVEEPPPLVVDLYYLLTAHALTAQPDEPIKAQRALSRAMRVLYDSGIVAGSAIQSTSDNGLTSADTLRITLNPISMEDMTRIWSVFPDTQYELSVTYLVTPVPIQSERQLGSVPVVDQIHEQGHFVAPAGRR
jgi:hypothetical protein